ncbi:hypothetical protein CBR_g8560 [Chara braunii]|uniref:Retrotransposon gag domain-containing protein n=1 Tax=Chara braunii TaxID=69332 RepID=A0A388JRW1_CHABU|nr:hypothetical protein CBR_g8560 [Chara braunii]|eukprot:GBG60536.1 hypothetical protein CBR_g8560 [Chara braunii]
MEGADTSRLFVFSIGSCFGTRHLAMSLLLLLLLLLTQSRVQGQTQLDIVMEIKQELGDPPGLSNLQRNSICDVGSPDRKKTDALLTCTNGSVTALDFSELNLNSILPKSIAKLTNLTSLTLKSNFFYGSIPASYGMLTKLTILSLSNNNLTGIIPDELGNLKLLEVLGLSGNGLTGSLPKSLGGLHSLREMYAHSIYSETTTAELSKWEEEEAARQQEIQCQLAEAEAARHQAAAEAAAAARLQQQQVEASQNQVRYQATMELANEESTYRRILRQQHFQANDEQEESTEEERNKEARTVLMENLLYTCNWQQHELLAMRQVFIRHETTFKALDKKIATLQAEISTLHAANSQQQTLNDQLQTDVSMGLAQLSAAASAGSTVADCSPALATLSDHVQQRPAAVAEEWKMPNFKIEKFDDYHKTDPLQWWMAFNAEADVHHTPAIRRLDALYLQLNGGVQAFMTHIAVTLECTIATLHTKITWEEFEKKWKTRLMVNNDKRHALNKIFHIFQGQQTSREWLTEWQRLVATPELNLPFDSIRAEFFARSCDALTAALGSEFQHETFDDMISKARELIQVPPPSTDDGLAVVDLRNYLAKIDREYATQRCVDIDVTLLYIRIQIGKATCSALIDCGATRNYISQDFMASVGLGPHVRRKSQPTHVTLADGHTQKSIDRCIDSVPLYFAPLACEVVSFDILDTKFDMILGMSWLQSEDQPVNFYRRTVRVRDRRGELVLCAVPLPHPSIGCHVVSAASIRQSIRRNDIEEMGICFLHALPPDDQPKTDTSDPRIIELLDNYEVVFQAPAGVVPDRPIRHGITLEDGAVPPRVYMHERRGASSASGTTRRPLGQGLDSP